MARRVDAPKPVPGITPKWAEGLTHRERAFVTEYLRDLNATQAAYRIGKENQFDGKDYANKQSASTAGHQFLAKPEVAKAIEIAFNEVAVTRQWIISEIAKVAKADLSKFGRLKSDLVVCKDGEERSVQSIEWYDHDKIDPELLPLMSEMSETFDKFGNKVISIKLRDDRPALRYLAKLMRMEVERTEISGPDGGPVVTESPRSILEARLADVAAKLAAADKPAVIENGSSPI